MNKSILSLGAVVLISLSSPVPASDLTIPNTFVSGTPAKAAEVNANFTAVKTAVDDNNARITTNTSAITTLQTQIGNKLDASALGAALDTATTTAGNSIDANAAALAGKAAVNHTHTANDCTSDMVKVGSICMDKYEAFVTKDAAGTAAAVPGDCSVTGNNCTKTTNNPNITPVPIYAQSMAGVTPSSGFTWFQAQQACANVGKRLPTNAEWQMAVAGTPDDAGVSCKSGGVTLGVTGTATCVSNHGVYDMVGNLNEWVADWMPAATGVGGSGAVTAVAGTTNASYGSDKMVAAPALNQGGVANNMPAAIIRGGSHFTTPASDAGIFFFTSAAAPSFADQYVGFRCVR